MLLCKIYILVDFFKEKLQELRKIFFQNFFPHAVLLCGRFFLLFCFLFHSNYIISSVF